MEKNALRLAKQVEARIGSVPPEILRRYSEAKDAVVFGSFAQGLEVATSDLDLFCIGACKTHFKSKIIEILILPEDDLYSELWLGSELANHIATFGVPLTAIPEWFSSANISPGAVAKKSQRIRGYLRSLERYWPSLSLPMRQKYEVRVRREVQRLSLLSHSLAVPPTKKLDDIFGSARATRADFLDSLRLQDRDALRRLFPGLFIG